MKKIDVESSFSLAWVGVEFSESDLDGFAHEVDALLDLVDPEMRGEWVEFQKCSRGEMHTMAKQVLFGLGLILHLPPDIPFADVLESLESWEGPQLDSRWADLRVMLARWCGLDSRSPLRPLAHPGLTFNDLDGREQLWDEWIRSKDRTEFVKAPD